MTIAEAIEQGDALTPNGYTQSMKIDWLSRLDLTVYNEILTTHSNLPLAFARVWDVEEWDEDATYSADDLVVYDGLIYESLKDSNTVEPCDIDDDDPEWSVYEIEFSGYDGLTSASQELLIPEPYCHIYTKWIETQVNYYNGDYGRYNNSLQAFKDAYSEYRNWYNSRNMPLGKKLRYFR